MVPKQEPLFNYPAGSKLIEVHPLQERMREFYKNNPRSVITAPRQSGKSVFLIMQATLAREPVLIIAHNTSASKMLSQMLRQLCKDNSIEYTQTIVKGPGQYCISIGINKIMITTPFAANGYISSGLYTVYIDEYDLIDLKMLNLQHLNNALLVGTSTGKSANLTQAQIGLFAGLNVNED